MPGKRTSSEDKAKAGAGTVAAQKKASAGKGAPAKKTASRKKLGLESSATRTALVDATEKLIRTKGVAAITSRIIAAEAKLKPQLIHYYFHTMDDLYVEVFRRGAEADLKRMAAALGAEHPLRAMWRLSADPQSARFATEFIALANHNDAVRAEISYYAKRRRELQVEIITRLLAARGFKPRVPPVVTAILMENAARSLLLESALGVSFGHDEMQVFVEACLRLIEDSGDMSAEAEGLLSANGARKANPAAAPRAAPKRTRTRRS